jgi:hypothetical protein
MTRLMHCRIGKEVQGRIERERRSKEAAIDRETCRVRGHGKPRKMQYDTYTLNWVTEIPASSPCDLYPYSQMASLNCGLVTTISLMVTPALVWIGSTTVCILASMLKTRALYFRSSTRYPPATNTFAGQEAAVGFSGVSMISELGCIEIAKIRR